MSDPGHERAAAALAYGRETWSRELRLTGRQGVVLLHVPGWPASSARNGKSDVYAQPAALIHPEDTWCVDGIGGADDVRSACAVLQIIRGLFEIVTVSLDEVARCEGPWPTSVRVPPRQNLSLRIENQTNEALEPFSLQLHWSVKT